MQPYLPGQSTQFQCNNGQLYGAPPTCITGWLAICTKFTSIWLLCKDEQEERGLPCGIFQGPLSRQNVWATWGEHKEIVQLSTIPLTIFYAIGKPFCQLRLFSNEYAGHDDECECNCVIKLSSAIAFALPLAKKILEVHSHLPEIVRNSMSRRQAGSKQHCSHTHTHTHDDPYTSTHTM